MKFRARLFTGLALVAVAWIVVGLSATNNTLSNQLSKSTSTAYSVGTYTGAGIVTSFVLCTGIPLLLTFLFIAWRNRVALRNVQQHKEIIESLKQR